MAYLGTNSLCGGFHTANSSALPDPISNWKLDGNGTDDEGVANLTLNGTPETGLDPLLASGSVSSIGFDGTDDYGEATHNAAHIAVKAILVTIQPDSTPSSGNRVFLGKGTFVDDGEISMEQRPTGLSVYIFNDGDAFWQSESGSSTPVVALTVDVAHQILFQAGPSSGTELWHRPAGGSWSMVGSSEADFDISANTENWFVGKSPYGAALFDGVIDGVVLYPARLGAAMREQIPAPASITHEDEAPTAGDEPQIPSLAEWLTNDDTADPPGATVVTSASAFTTALAAADPGDTIVINDSASEAFYDIPDGLTCPSGTAGNPITIMARQNKAVIMSRCEDFAVFRTTGAGNWTQSGLSQADIDKKIWRSTALFAGGAQTLMGFWIEFDHPHQMVRCNSMTDLRAAYSTADSPTGYSGPQARVDSDGRVYIRMQKPHPDKYSLDAKWSGREWPGHPEAYSNGVINYPVSEDPNDYVIHLFRAGFTSGNNVAFDCGASGGHFVIGPGINSLGNGQVLRGSNITVKRGTHLTWRYGLNFVPGGTADQGEWYCDRARFSDGSKIHLARSEWKFNGWLESVRSEFVGAQFSNRDGWRGLYMLNCTVADFHEIAIYGYAEVRWRNCSFLHILDDGYQVRTDYGSRCEFGYCYFRGTAVRGPGEGGNEADDPNPGEIFIHHCIVDNRENRVTNWNSQPHPHFIELQHSADHNKPNKIYNNTFIVGPDLEQQQVANPFSHNHDQNNTATGTAAAHEDFNNISVRQDNQRYDGSTGYSDGSLTGPSDHMMRYMNCDADLSNEFHDYDLFYKDVTGSQADGWGKNIQNGRNNGAQSFATLAAFKSSGLFTTSKASGSKRGAYTPGFHNNSLESQPPIPSIVNFPNDRFNYRPTSAMAGTSGSLSGADWWTVDPSWGGDYFAWDAGGGSLAPDDFKGALDPDGSTMTVGVIDQ